MSTEPAIPWQLELDDQAFRDRLEWARRQGHPQYLWPAVPVESWRWALAELERVIASALASGHPSLRAPTPEAARALGVAAHSAGVGPLVGHWIEAGRLATDPLLARLFGLHLRHGRRRAERLREILLDAADALAGVDIQPLAVKSSHTAGWCFPEPGARPGMDVDLVVAPAEFEAAEAALAASGFSVGAREYRPRKTTWLAPGSRALPRSVELLHEESQYVVDLHGSLERNFFGVRTVSPGAPTSVPTEAARAMGATRVLAQPALLLYHALHASEGLHNLTLIRIIELVFMIRQDAAAGRLDWSAFEALTADRQAWRFVFPALHMAERLAPGTVDAQVLERARSAATPRMVRVLGRTSPGRARRLEGRSLDESFMWCATPMDHVRRLVHMAFPAPAGRSPARLARYYVERAYRLVRGTASLGPSEEPRDGPIS